MATAGIAYVFKQDILQGNADLEANTHNIALYQDTSDLAPSQATYGTATNEVGSSGDYSAGGSAVTNGTVAIDGTTAHWTPTADLSWTGVTFDVGAALLYDTTNANAAVACFTFTTQSVSNGTFSLQMPTDNGTTGLIRIA